MTQFKPYCFLPDYADVEYVDGKLEVARLAAQSSNPQAAKAWKETIDVLLIQRQGLLELENGPD